MSNDEIEIDFKIVRTLKIFFVQKSIFIDLYCFQSQSGLWESMAAFFQQSAGYVVNFDI